MSNKLLLDFAPHDWRRIIEMLWWSGIVQPRLRTPRPASLLGRPRLSTKTTARTHVRRKKAA